MNERKLSIDSDSFSHLHSVNRNLSALGVISAKPIRKIFKDGEKLPYMKSQIDLSFPEIQNNQ
jgi:hypothetical protein